jgi:putative YhbY family RNA-binding protein
MEATVWIGKEGPSDELTKHLAAQLKSRELVKLKVHKSALTETETSALANKMASLTGATLVEVMGHTFTLFKKRETSEAAKRAAKSKPVHRVGAN